MEFSNELCRRLWYSTDIMTLLELVCQKALEMKTLSNSPPIVVLQNMKKPNRLLCNIKKMFKRICQCV